MSEKIILAHYLECPGGQYKQVHDIPRVLYCRGMNTGSLLGMYQVEEFFSGLGIISKYAQHSGCYCFAVDLLDASHNHTHVSGNKKIHNLIQVMLLFQEIYGNDDDI